MADFSFEELKQMVAKTLSRDVAEINEQSSLVDDLGADSLDVAELEIVLMERLGFDFEDTDRTTIKTVGELWENISKRLTHEI